MNVVLLEGTLSRDVVLRELPSGVRVAALEVTTRTPDGSALSVPVEWFEPRPEPTWAAGTPVVVFGTVRRRFFRAGATTQSRTTVVAERAVPATDRRAVSRLRSSLRRLLDR